MMTPSVYLERIIGHLGAAAVQRSFHDDRIIADHIDEALEAARELKAELAKTGEKVNGQHNQAQ